ncbi:unnamed protein product [Fusarium venenatum]|uniref:Uncharacterized protein n=1 Tax=Fusarium venenatum TaxID=56646 RepID=A0A2L2T838_9HYPO|nr:uncharacterized protein FVRRES_03554 [Fusarium venenatum]CEI67042.1 unnamed protein product [Fusarium venenatum]
MLLSVIVTAQAYRTPLCDAADYDISLCAQRRVLQPYSEKDSTNVSTRRASPLLGLYSSQAGDNKMNEERDGPFTGDMFEAEVARNDVPLWTRVPYGI